MVLRRLGRSFTAVALVATSAAFAILGACSSFNEDDPSPSSDGGNPGVESSTDAPIADSPSDGSTGADAGYVNLLENGDFELLKCGAWTSTNGSLDVDTTARTGMRSCRVCSTTAVAYWLETVVTRAVGVGERYIFEAYLRAAPDASAESVTKANILVNNGNLENGPTSSGPLVGDVWRPINAVITIAKEGGVSLTAKISGVTPGTCFLIDDAVLYRED